MEEHDRTPSPFASSSSSASRNEEASGAASTSTTTSSSQARDEDHKEEEEEEEDDVHDDLSQSPQPALIQQLTTVSYNADPTTNESSIDDSWSCFIVLLTFSFFVSTTLILGVYGSVSLQLGANSSILIKPNALLVDYVKVKQLDETSSGQMLYGFYKDPQLDVVTNWSEIRNAPLLASSHKAEGKFKLLKVCSEKALYIQVIFHHRNEGLAQWLEDPSYPNITMSWNIIRGNGVIQQNITKSSNYYAAVANLNTEVVEVQLNLTIKSFLYNTSGAFSKCMFTRGQCSLKMFFPNGNAALLTTPGTEEGSSNDQWYLKLSYEPRWITYIIGTGGMTFVILLAFHFFKNFRCTREDRVQYGGMESQRALLLSQKDDDVLSWGSSYDSLSQGDEDPEDGLVDGKQLKDGEYNNNTRRLCAICFDAPRDCFFLPCGHCVACFACGTRIAEAAGTCPICRRNMKKVRKIFAV
ncbi:hypothetical protein LguiA_016386 [Lonicera macranthoides]